MLACLGWRLLAYTMERKVKRNLLAESDWRRSPSLAVQPEHHVAAERWHATTAGRM